MSITVNGFTKSTSYGQSSTASSIASALGSAFNGDGASPVSASVSGPTVTLTAKTGGAATNYALSTSSATTQSGFTGTSFPASSGASLTGGADSYQYPTTPYSANLTYFPNGNVATANENVNGNWTYGYDDFNRLASSSKTGASYTYVYDRYGNRWQQNGPLSSILTFSSGNNRMDGYSYDAAGNVLNDNAGHSFTYDADNRIIQVGTNVTYVYDGEGRRIRRVISGSSVDFLYELAGREVAEMNSSGGWNRGEVFAAGRHIATYNNSTTYFTHADWLGTERSRSTVTGAVCQTTSSLPFGDGVLTTGNCNPSPNFFTGKERDSETANDYFGARYYSSTMGRWMSPDWVAIPTAVPYADVSDPQSLNLYSYAHNNPVSLEDTDGHKDDQCGFWCRLGQRVVNSIKYGEPVTNAQLPAAFAKERKWLTDNLETRDGSPLNDKQRNTINAASDEDVNKLYKHFMGAAMGTDDHAFDPEMPYGSQSKYEDTTKGNSVPNKTTDVSRADFERNLTNDGWTKRMSADGKATIYEKDGARYVVRDNASSTGKPTADFYRPGSGEIGLKIRMPK